MKNIFPKEIIENTIEVHRFKHSVKSKIIYSILLLSILSIGASLPYVSLDIYSSSQGILKSEKERNQITSLYSGRIEAITIKENDYVKKGDTLLVINNSVGKEKQDLLLNQLEETRLFVHDLNYLSRNNWIRQDSLQSFLYQKEYLQYLQKLRELQTHYTKNKRDFIRQEKLYNKDVIARVEYEESKYSYDLAVGNLSHFKKQQRNQWQSSLIQQRNKADELESSLAQMQEEQNNYIITASITGTIQSLKGLEVGNFIASGSPIAEISPDTDLIVEFYIKPSDIGLLKENSAVKFQIDAFNYNQWGMATGKIVSINKDISIINNVPLFRVICSLDQKELQLKNGFKGKFKKGMTLNARFFVVNRTAFELLYDKVDDWFNPSKSVGSIQ
ncbi:MAG: HlyD family secretion protein [Flavobacteriaceae bacterium]|nr:HlyD family secretion protein [Flavobacteriaceae bacterium]